MQTASTKAAYPVNVIPPEPPADESIIIDRSEEKAFNTFCVVNVGDVLTERQKRPTIFRLGGKLYPWEDFKTVPNQIVEQCAITRLRPAMREVHESLVDPKELHHYIRSYTHTNVWSRTQGRYVDLNVGRKYFVYREVRPISELKTILTAGTVHIPDEAGLTSSQAIKAAQLFFFPNWLEIRTGEQTQFDVLAKLEDHIANRLAATTSPQFKAVGAAYLQSASEFRQWAQDYIAEQTAKIDEVKEKGITIRYDEIAERLFKFVGLQRRDQLIESIALGAANAPATDPNLVTAVTLLTELIARQNKVVDSINIEGQPAVPTDTEQAYREMTIQNTDEQFVDMTAVTIDAINDVSDDAIDDAGDDDAGDDDAGDDTAEEAVDAK